jgi:hypothetical protein
VRLHMRPQPLCTQPLLAVVLAVVGSVRVV